LAVTGGLNIGNPYFRVDPEDPDANWRDQDVVVRGAVVDDLMAAFDRNFRYLVDIKKSRGVFNTNLYWEGTRALLDHTGKFPVRYSTDAERVRSASALEARRPELNFRSARCRFLQSRPRMQESYIHQAYLKLIGRAREEILIANAYFVPTPSIRHALQDAAKRCVAIKIISNSPATNDLPEISLVGRGYYGELLAVNESPEVVDCDHPEAGIRIWEWVGRKPDEQVNRQGTMHSKYAVFDQTRNLVGSYNLDPRSQRLNSETALVFEEQALAATLRRLFLEQDLSYSTRVTPEQAAGFETPENVVRRFRKSLGTLFEGEL
jgi:phosphatidylserine/phosphatidylglycerophosphate/cardiolipin synthase-like enzyme